MSLVAMAGMLVRNRSFVVAAGALAALLVPVGAIAGSLPSGERQHGNVSVEPAYNDADGAIIYLQTPNHLAPLGPTNVINGVDPHAVAPLYLVVYPPGTTGTFNCMGVPGNCPDHDPTIAKVAVSVERGVYGQDPALVPGHDHLVAGQHSGDFNVPWHVYVELFTSSGAVTHVTTLTELDALKASGALTEVDTGIVFLCSIVSQAAYQVGTPVS